MDQDNDKRLAATIDLLGQLVGFNTESSLSNWPIVRFIEDYLRARDVPFVTVPNAAGDKAAILATVGPMRDGGIVLSGHTDVVPVEGQSWTGDPFVLRREQGRLYGRGATDMKGFDAVALAMIDEFRTAGLTRPVHILLSYDEEVSCLGSIDAIARFGADLPRPAGVVVGEPTGMLVADAHKAIATYRTSVRGLEAHSSQPHLGANAIEAAAALVTCLYALADELAATPDPSGRFDPPYATLSVGTVEGGTARNILARDCAFHWEFRSLPGMDQSFALDRLDAFVSGQALPRLARFVPADRADEIWIRTQTEVEVPGLAPDSGSPAESLALKLTRSNRTIAVSFATEAGQFQKRGLPAVVCGPGSIDQAHQPDEFIEISQLAECIAFMRRLAVELR